MSSLSELASLETPCPSQPRALTAYPFISRTITLSHQFDIYGNVLSDLGNTASTVLLLRLRELSTVACLI